MWRRVGTLLALCLLVAAGVTARIYAAEADTDAAAVRRQAQAVLSSMTLDQKIGALFMVRPETLGGVTSPGPDLAENYSRCPVSGVAFFAPNLKGPSQVRDYVSQLQALGDVPLLIGVDQEGGRISRFPGSFAMPDLPSMYSIGQGGDPDRAYQGLYDTGVKLKQYGFNVDFAPVADIWSNPANKVIGDRAFSDTARGAAPFVRQAVAGLERAGIVSCLKHFPGHGDTCADSHTGAAISYVDAATLRKRELIPFAEGMKAGARLVMVSHILLPEVSKGDLPASLSPDVVDGLLRGDLGFDGVVITDALDMGAIATYYSPEEAAVLAIRAGCDILLMPTDLQRAFDGIKAAVRSGALSEARIDQSILRIISLRLAVSRPS